MTLFALRWTLVPLLLAFFPLVAVGAAVFGGFCFGVGIFVRALLVIALRTVIVLPVVTAFFAGPAFALLLGARFLAATEIGEHAEIMVGELQMIFRIDAVVIELRVLRHFLVFFQHLRRVAARPVVDAVVIIKTAAIVVLLPVVVIVVVIATATAVVVILRPVVVSIHQDLPCP